MQVIKAATTPVFFQRYFSKAALASPTIWNQDPLLAAQDFSGNWAIAMSVSVTETRSNQAQISIHFPASSDVQAHAITVSLKRATDNSWMIGGVVSDDTQ